MANDDSHSSEESAQQEDQSAQQEDPSEQLRRLERQIRELQRVVEARETSPYVTFTATDFPRLRRIARGAPGEAHRPAEVSGIFQLGEDLFAPIAGSGGENEAEPWPVSPAHASNEAASMPQDSGDVGGAAHTERKTPAPAGKVKASFNLLPKEIESLRVMAKQLGTTVTSVLQRAIRDERFVQDQLAEGHRFAVVDRRGAVREIIWR